jgi:2-dehydro-3-deoxy-D-arabinonate dehydratase
MKLFNTTFGIILQDDQAFYRVEEDWDDLINRDQLHSFLAKKEYRRNVISPEEINMDKNLLPPVGGQEVWAAGVTYLRSREARMEESKAGGGADFYNKVYEADRPELFFKALPHRVAAHNSPVFIRRDSKWNVPEPELTLFINSNGNIEGYTIGNDMSSRDIEGENPLYLPQAKVYERSAALGPCLYIAEDPLPPETFISITIRRTGAIVFQGDIQLKQMKRKFTELASYLFRECNFDRGVFLMTGTGIVPPNDFTLHSKDLIEIVIEPIGKLVNTVSSR